jgi:hypothetical protein
MDEQVQQLLDRFDRIPEEQRHAWVTEGLSEADAQRVIAGLTLRELRAQGQRAQRQQKGKAMINPALKWQNLVAVGGAHLRVLEGDHDGNGETTKRLVIRIDPEYQAQINTAHQHVMARERHDVEIMHERNQAFIALKNEIFAAVYSELPAELRETLATTYAELQRREQHATEARERANAHAAARPGPNLDAVAAWAQQKATLEAEASTWELLTSEARPAYEAAAAAVIEAYRNRAAEHSKLLAQGIQIARMERRVLELQGKFAEEDAFETWRAACSTIDRVNNEGAAAFVSLLHEQQKEAA